MIFSSTLFLFYFLPLVLVTYFFAPPKAKNLVLLLFSLVFYAWGEPVYITIMIFSILFNYVCGLLVSHRRGVLLLSVLVNLGMLIFFKYTNFLIDIVNLVSPWKLSVLSLSLPVGISFYTFQTMSYVIDVYRGDARPQKNLISFGAYVALFPQLIAGPIVRYNTIEQQLPHRTVTLHGVTTGILYFTVGLAKKVLLANNIGMLWDAASASGQLSATYAWLGIIAFAFQIYFDFSGYSDMAIGLGRLFGFSFDQNFDHPYISCSITDFWRRWHISLSTWFKEYVYIPLGGNRVSKQRRRVNLLIVWGLTGLWHGASFHFIAWGLYYAVLLILEKELWGEKIARLPKLVQWLYAIVLVMIGWVFFACNTLGDAFRYLGSMFGRAGFIDSSARYAFSSYRLMLLICTVAMLPYGAKLGRKLLEKSPLYLLLPAIVIFILCLAYLADASYNPFLYFRF